MPDDQYGLLLTELPRIAEAVSRFQSPEIQQQAFTALTRALGFHLHRAGPAPAQDIDFRPAGQQSLIDFTAERNPTNNNDRNLLAIYYMEHVLGLDNLTTDHVKAAYEQCEWRQPSSFLRSLQLTASHTSWITTRHMHDIRTTPEGIARAEHDIPHPASMHAASTR